MSVQLTAEELQQFQKVRNITKKLNVDLFDGKI